jgi:TonB family protein
MREQQEIRMSASAMKRCLTVKSLFVILFCYLAAFRPNSAGADDRKDLEGNLRRAFEDKLLSLRDPHFGRRLQFDSSGKLVSKAEAGPWSTCGLLKVSKVILRQDHIEIDGKRALLVLRRGPTDNQPSSIPQQGDQITALVTDDAVSIFVEISTLDAPQVSQIISHVFQGGQLQDRVAAYWKPNTNDLKAFQSNTPNGVVAQLEGSRPVYLVHPSTVSPPRTTYQPDPTFTETARQNRVGGTAILSVVVNERGFPELLEITQGLGYGLDIQALAAVAQWRFKPAMKDGQPVAVLINVEVEFHLSK